MKLADCCNEPDSSLAIHDRQQQVDRQNDCSEPCCRSCWPDPAARFVSVDDAGPGRVRRLVSAAATLM